MFRSPLAEFHLGRFRGEFKFPTLIRASHGIKSAFPQGVPDGAGIPIVQDKNVVERVSGRAKFNGFPFVDLAVANCSQLDERSPAHRKGRSIEIVINDFVMIEYLDRVCACDSVMFEADDYGVVIDTCFCKSRVADLGEFGFIN